MALVRNVVEYIDGRESALHEVLWEGLEEAAEALDFERASRLRRELTASLALTIAQRRLRESVEAMAMILVTPAAEPACRELLMVVRGRIWAQLRFCKTEAPDELGERLATSWQRFETFGLAEPDHETIDEIAILGSWLARHDGHPALLPIPNDKILDWRLLVKRALALTDEELDFDAWRKARDMQEADQAAMALESDGSLWPEGPL
jgi:UvrB/uvrC motif